MPKPSDITICNVWNEQVEIGTPVIVVKDDGERVETHTLSKASIVSNHPVIWLYGVRGYYLLERVVVKLRDPPQEDARDAAILMKPEEKGEKVKGIHI